jgi:NitT/TauT family transport system ATP-binding protein
MQELLLSILRGHPVSTVFVTHDLGEAIALSDRVVALAGSPGRLGLDCAIESSGDRDDLMAVRSTPEFTEYQTRLWEIISSPSTTGGRK